MHQYGAHHGEHDETGTIAADVSASSTLIANASGGANTSIASNSTNTSRPAQRRRRHSDDGSPGPPRGTLEGQGKEGEGGGGGTLQARRASGAAAPAPKEWPAYMTSTEGNMFSLAVEETAGKTSTYLRVLWQISFMNAHADTTSRDDLAMCFNLHIMFHVIAC